MTRENKLALVVGFGLILFVGILISDHFAPSPHRTNADLVDPNLKQSASRRGDLTELKPRSPLVAVPGNGSNDVLGPGIQRATGQPEPTPEEAVAKANVPAPGEPIIGPAPSERVYVIREGDTLYSIARRELGDGTLWPKLQEINGIKGSKSLRPGEKLRLPSAESAGGTRLARNDEPANRAEVPAIREYTVRDGDTFSSIAEKLLGKRSRWQELFDLNKGRVKDPDRLAPGTRLSIPTAASGGTRA